MSDQTRDCSASGFSAELLGNLRQALASNGAHPPRDGSTVHGAIQLLAREARQAGTPVEQVIIQLKAEWHALGLAGRDAPRAEGAVVVQRLITICLDAYFAED